MRVPPTCHAATNNIENMHNDNNNNDNNDNQIDNDNDKITIK